MAQEQSDAIWRRFRGACDTFFGRRAENDKTRDQERGKKYGLGSTTANESVGLLELIHAGKVVTPSACKAMLGHLKANDDKDKMVRFLPEGTVVGHTRVRRSGLSATGRTPVSDPATAARRSQQAQIRGRPTPKCSSITPAQRLSGGTA